MSVKSPVTYSTNTSIADRFDTSELIGLYAKEGIDVKRFFTGMTQVDLYRCDDTGYRFFYPESIFGDNQFYQDLYQKIPGYYHVNRWEHQASKTLVEKGSSLLEVGCGDGFFLQSVSGICSRTKGLELNTEAIRVAREKGLDVEATTIQDYASALDEPYDIVCCFQVLEHIYDIRSFMTAMRRCVKPGGLLIIAVPNNNPHLFKRDKKHFLNLPPHHAGLWGKASLEQLAPLFQLQVYSIRFEPLVELKMWFKAQVRYYREHSPLFGSILSLIPRQVYKPVLRLMRRRIQGKTVLATYKAV